VRWSAYSPSLRHGRRPIHHEPHFAGDGSRRRCRSVSERESLVSCRHQHAPWRNLLHASLPGRNNPRPPALSLTLQTHETPFQATHRILRNIHRHKAKPINKLTLRETDSGRAQRFRSPSGCISRREDRYRIPAESWPASRSNLLIQAVASAVGKTGIAFPPNRGPPAEATFSFQPKQPSHSQRIPRTESTP
jgi:hypothetical protein